MKNTYLILILTTFILSCSDKKKDIVKEVQPVASEDTVIEDRDEKTNTIIFFGNSLTAGYGLEPEQAFPALVQNMIDSLDLNYTVVNAGLSGETTASGRNRVDWVLKQNVDVFILELGANDGLRGIDTDETYQNLEAIVKSVREKNEDVKIVLAGMMVPPNMGQDYGAAFQKIFPSIAEKHSLSLIPFLLQGVGGQEDLNLPDGIHPNVEGHKIVAGNVWQILKDVL